MSASACAIVHVCDLDVEHRLRGFSSLPLDDAPVSACLYVSARAFEVRCVRLRLPFERAFIDPVIM